MAVFKRRKEELKEIKKEILDSYLYFAIKEYGIENASKQLSGYITLNDINCITRTNDFRGKFENYLKGKDILEMLNGQKIIDYAYNLGKKKEVNQNSNNYKEKLIEKAIKDTYLVSKNPEKVKLALKVAIQLNDFAMITNQKTPGLREELSNTFSDGEVKEVIESLLTRKKIPYGERSSSNNIAEQYFKLVMDHAIIFADDQRVK